ncbi:hypothetical protein [Streptomyces canus]|uniref:hypothetical protein n=1 Tax=Streptomyces canus TaxID=58343 RepID=UPI00386DAFFB
MRAEDLSSAQLAEPEKAGLDVVRLPIRDDETPRPAQMQRFLDVVARSAVRRNLAVGPPSIEQI